MAPNEGFKHSISAYIYTYKTLAAFEMHQSATTQTQTNSHNEMLILTRH